MTIGQIDPNIALIIYINDIFWILFDCKVNMCDWLTAPTSRDLSGTSDLHENIIFEYRARFWEVGPEIKRFSCY